MLKVHDQHGRDVYINPLHIQFVREGSTATGDHAADGGVVTYISVLYAGERFQIDQTAEQVATRIQHLLRER